MDAQKTKDGSISQAVRLESIDICLTIAHTEKRPMPCAGIEGIALYNGKAIFLPFHFRSVPAMEPQPFNAVVKEMRKSQPCRFFRF